MKLSGKTTRKTSAAADASANYRACYDNVLGDTLWRYLCYVAAEVLDEAILHGDCYMIIGATKDRSAMSVTVVSGSERDTRYGNSGVEELLSGLEDLVKG